MSKVFSLSNYRFDSEKKEVNWEKAKAGDGDELHKIISNNIGTIKQVATTRRGLDDDLLQHLMLKTIEVGVNNYNPNRSTRFNTYLKHVLESRKINYIERGNDAIDDCLSLNYEYEDDKTLEVESDKDTEATALNNSVVDFLKDKLDSEQLFVLECYYYEQCTYEEIGKRLGITHQAIGKRMKKIKKKLKKILSYAW